ncbi:hypothetical protein CF326_g6355 [Tilletia indica]|nr:hypothetical protein CF326_g6355 [Tilletia indica]
MSTAQVESRPTPSAATAYDTPATTSANHNANATGSGAPGEAAHQRQGGGAGGAGGGRDRRRRGKGPAGGAAESDNHGQGRGGGRGGGGGGGGGASAEVNADRAAQQQNGNRNQGSSNRSANNGRGRGNGRPARGNATGSARAHVEAGIENAAANSGGNGGRQRQGRGKPKENAPAAPSSSAEAGAPPAAAEPTVSSRKRNFGGKITTGEAATTSRGGADVKGKGVAQAYVPPIIREYADLRSRLVAELGSGSYECSICYNTLTTRQPCWSCDQCYTVLHISCTKKWASTSVDQANAHLAMQEDPEMRARRGTWRCPGCQFAREDVPQAYWCWCGRVKEPQPRGGLNPHSCGQRCAKGSCPHGGCAEPCHPGPCAPCAVTVSKRCHCGKHTLPIRCSQINPSTRAGGAGLQPGVATIPSEAPAAVQIERGISCSEVCGRLLNCGTHSCAAVCHPGACSPCAEHINAKCYCGLQEKDLVCGSEGKAQRCVREDDSTEWVGLWACETVQQKPYDCGKHFYDQSCSSSSHTTDRPPCPRSPERVKTCPCGKTELTSRTSCEDDIPTCGSKCEKVQLCGHLDSDTKCHHGPCPPCRVQMTTPCRCGESKQTRQCYEHQREESEGGQEILCAALCKALRNCGKHQKSKCGASTSNPAGRERALKCNDTCAIAQRNMKLADALGINYAEKVAPAVYETDTIKFYASHRAFGDEVERALSEFVTSSRNGMILPAAKREHRKFTHELAAVYKLASESVDAEPKRSVSIRRLQGSRIPSPLLSEVWSNALSDAAPASATSSKLSTAPIDRNRPTSTSSGGASAVGNLPLNAIILEHVFGHSAASLREHLETLPGGLLNSVPFTLRWVSDENVLLTFEQTPATLVRIRSGLREMLGRTGLAARALLCVVGRDGNVLRTEEDAGPSSMSGGGGGAGGNGSGGAVQRLTTSMSRTASGPGSNAHSPSLGGPSSGAPAKKLGGWAAIASGSATTQASRLATSSSSVWDSGSRRSGAGPSVGATNGLSSTSQASGRVVLTTSASNSARPSPRMELPPSFTATREATPDDWEID